MLLECTHCNYNVCLLYFRVFPVSPLPCKCVSLWHVCLQCSVWTCVLHSIVLLWHHSSFQYQFLNKPYMKSCLFVSFHGSTLEGTQSRVLHDWHRWNPADTPLQCKDSPFGPSAQIEHPWTTAVAPWEEKPVAPAANWSASSRTNSNKEILVTRLLHCFILSIEIRLVILHDWKVILDDHKLTPGWCQYFIQVFTCLNPIE